MVGCSLTRFSKTLEELQLTMYEIDQIPEEIVANTILDTYNELGEEKVEFHMWVFEVKEVTTCHYLKKKVKRK